MIDKPNDVVALIHQAMRQLKLKDRAHVELKKFYRYEIKQTGQGQIKEQEPNPRWFVKFFYPYPADQHPKSFTVRIEPGKYETKEQLLGFIVRMIGNHAT